MASMTTKTDIGLKAIVLLKQITRCPRHLQTNQDKILIEIEGPLIESIRQLLKGNDELDGD